MPIWSALISAPPLSTSKHAHMHDTHLHILVLVCARTQSMSRDECRFRHSFHCDCGQGPWYFPHVFVCICIDYCDSPFLPQYKCILAMWAFLVILLWSQHRIIWARLEFALTVPAYYLVGCLFLHMEIWLLHIKYPWRIERITRNICTHCIGAFCLFSVLCLWYRRRTCMCINVCM